MVLVTARSTTIDSVPRGEYVPTADHRIALHGLSWTAFESFLALRGDGGPRVTYLEGTLQLMSPSRDHEQIKKALAAIVEAYLDHLGVRYVGAGAWLVKHAPNDAALEPDECYILHDRTKARPDLALEVVWTSGGIDKLDVYRRLAIPEVWFWESNAITFYVLGEAGYIATAVSSAIPSFDKQLAAELMELEYLSDVRAALRQRLG